MDKQTPQNRGWAWRRIGPYGRQHRAEHRVVEVGHGLRPEYSRRVRRMRNRLFR